MSSNSRSWLDALTDGQVLRDLLSLNAHFFLGWFYFMLLVIGYSMAIGLSFILIGIPLLLFVLAGTRTLAAADRAMMAKVIDLEVPPVEEDLDLRGANLGERLGMILGSWTTWRSVIYLLAKIPIGMASISVMMLLLPLLFIELCILAPLTIDLRLISVRLLHWSTLLLFHLNSMMLPSAKTKRAVVERERRVSRLVTEEVEEAPKYYIGDDGEISVYKRGT